MLLFFAWRAYSACAIPRSWDVFELIDQSGDWANSADLRFSRTQSCTVLSGILIAAGQQPRAHLLSTRHTVARLYVSSKRALPAHTLDRPPFPRHHRQAGRGPFQRAPAAISGKSASTKIGTHTDPGGAGTTSPQIAVSVSLCPPESSAGSRSTGAPTISALGPIARLVTPIGSGRGSAIRIELGPLCLLGCVENLNRPSSANLRFSQVA
jgi:hypothetical protein